MPVHQTTEDRQQQEQERKSESRRVVEEMRGLLNMQNWTKDQKEKHQREWIAGQEWVMTRLGQQAERTRRTGDKSESTTSRMVQLTTAVPLQYGTLLHLCGLDPQEEDMVVR